MPGRRTPRKPANAKMNQHTRAAFPGGVDGGALIPYPTGLLKGRSERTGENSLLFFQDKFTGDGTNRTFPLAFRPLPYSERVFVDGFYRMEGSSAFWTRFDSASGTSVNFSSPPAADAQIVVEYAHYEQIPPEKDPCGPEAIYANVMLKGASAYTYDARRSAVLPFAENFPTAVVETTGYLAQAGNSYVKWYPRTGGSFSNITSITSVPGIAPGSTYARKAAGTGSNGWENSLTTVGMPRGIWSQATKSGQHLWYQTDGVRLSKNGSVELSHIVYWFHRDGGNMLFRHHLMYDTTNNTWAFYSNFVGAAGFSLTAILPVPNLGNMEDPGTHYVGWEIDTATKTVVITFDNATATLTHASIWPDPSYFEGEVWGDSSGTNRHSRDNIFLLPQSTTVTIDNWTITDNPPWCVWGVE